MIDDHIPFAVRGIPAVDLIDFDYPYWHTTADTIDKISAESLERVGRTLETFLESPLTSSAFLTEPRALLSCKSRSRIQIPSDLVCRASCHRERYSELPRSNAGLCSVYGCSCWVFDIGGCLFRASCIVDANTDS
jgi:hypothetical protein